MVQHLPEGDSEMSCSNHKLSILSSHVSMKYPAVQFYYIQFPTFLGFLNITFLIGWSNSNFNFIPNYPELMKMVWKFLWISQKVQFPCASSIRWRNLNLSSNEVLHKEIGIKMWLLPKKWRDLWIEGTNKPNVLKWSTESDTNLTVVCRHRWSR